MAPAPPGGDSPFREAYRDLWRWDDVHRGTHNLNCWYQQNCCFYVYTRDGRVVREEQVGDYPQTNPTVPDHNPRGCQKGCCYSSLMYSPPRVTRPLKRAGPRGSGAWLEVSWDQALTEIADQLIETLASHGSESIVLDPGGNIVSQLAWMSISKLWDALDGVYLDINCELGDDQQGAAVTYGEVAGDRSGDDYFHSDLVLIWGGNPAFTQIPNFHFLTEARYNGTRIVAISPDLNASAMHADEWIPVKPGTDAALALSMCQVMIEEGLYDADLVREQTDLSLLVVEETGRLLRKDDVTGGAMSTLYHWDSTRDRLQEVDRFSLDLGRVVPALEGSWSVLGDKGRRLRVKPAFELLVESLQQWTPERASEHCGVAPDTIRRLARMLAGAEAATNTCTSGLSKYYNGDLTLRAQILAFVLAGHLGTKGAGYVAGSFLLADGIDDRFSDFQKYQDLKWRMGLRWGLKYDWNRVRGMSRKEAITVLAQDVYLSSRMMVNSTLFWAVHGGLMELAGRTREWDPTLPREVSEYLDEALDKRWQVLEPAPDKDPRALLVWAGNPLRRVRGAHKLLEVLWPKLDLVVVSELRMSSTAVHADYVLPVSGTYEKVTTPAMNTTTLAPFFHTTCRAVPSVGESLDEWEVVCRLAEKLQERCQVLDRRYYVTRHGSTRSLETIHDDLTDRGRLGASQGEELSRRVVRDSTNLDTKRWEKLKEQGYTGFTSLGNTVTNWGNACDIRPGETISPHTWHTEHKTPWATLSGRIQFYIDHPWYLELGEQLPTHKPPPKVGGDHPIVLTGGHARWSIHATWRTDPTMLRLQRGEPCLWMSDEDARARGISDHDRVEVSNDLGRFVTRARPTPTVMPGQAVMYHGWENQQFEGGMGYRNVQGTPLKPLELVGDHPYMKPVTGLRQPGQSDRDTRVEIRRLEEAT